MILMYYRSYISHVFLGAIFNIDDSRVCRYFKTVEPALAEIFDIPKDRIDLNEEEITRLIIDATEQETQKRDGSGYSGKKKRNTVKTQITTDEKGTIRHISHSVAGNIHDKKLFDQTELMLPDSIPVLGDLGYVGTKLIIPYKSSKLHRLTESQQQSNQKHSKLRIVVEHVFAHLKKFRVLADRFRNNIKSYNMIFRIICGLRNLMIA